MLSSPTLHLCPPQIPELQPRTTLSKFKSNYPHTPRQFSPFTSQPPRTKRTLGHTNSFLGPSCSNSLAPFSPEKDLDVELGRLLALLPEEMRRRVNEHPELRQLIEVVMDLGRKPLARFPSGDFVLSSYPITVEDLEHATSMVSEQI